MVVKQVSCYTVSLTIEKLDESSMNVTLHKLCYFLVVINLMYSRLDLCFKIKCFLLY